MMRRIQDEKEAGQVISYLGISEKLAEGYKYKYERLYNNLVYNVKENRKDKIKLFFTGAVIPSLIWFFSAGAKTLVFSLKIVKGILNLVKSII